jgi:hypothetical protein
MGINKLKAQAGKKKMVTSAKSQKNEKKARSANLSLRITVPRVNKLRFMWQPSFNLAPAAND